MSKFISLYNNPRQTMLVQPDGNVVYEVKTEGHVSNVKRFLPNKVMDEASEDGERPFVVAGIIDWNKPASISVGGEKPTPMAQFLRLPESTNKFMKFMKLDESPDSREFTGPTGDAYIWKMAGEHLTLTRKGSKEPVASYTMEKGSLLGKDERAYMIVGQEGLEMMDTLVVTWVFMALMLNTNKSKGMFASTETEWATSGPTGVHAGTD